MIPTGNFVCDPLRAILDSREDAVLAVIADVQGPSYRPVGATMAIVGDAGRTGSLSSGCVENDIALHAARVLASGSPEIIRYGQGSPYVDIQLPCGGGLDILLLPNPDRQALADVVANHEQRRPCTLVIDVVLGTLSVTSTGATERDGDRLAVRVEPDIAFQVFGKGPVAATFAALVQSAGYPGTLLSQDAETLDAAGATGFATRQLVAPRYPDDLATDDRTAIVLFFHDHDWDPPILAAALETPAFYVGAQGGRRTRATRLQALEEMGVSEQARARLHGPIGLIPSARDARTLAISVLAEVLAAAMPDRQ
jgi:xanthine dehydrogenase accessory factor